MLIEPEREGGLRAAVSVVVPAWQARGTLLRTLRSVEASVAGHLDASGADAESCVIVVVDDGSSDGTLDAAAVFGLGSFLPVLALRNALNRDVSFTRNRGVAAVAADTVFHLDADDEFLPAHVGDCLRALAGDPAAGFVKTGIELPAPVHPDWVARIENSLTSNLCLRRRCHELIGGFHEGPAFRKLHCEDALYCDLLLRFFNGIHLAAATCRHHRSPGNAFDRQYPKLILPPEQAPDLLRPAERLALPEVERAHAARVAEVSARLDALRRGATSSA
ncbi:MAG: glycosyltransferase [Alphaproteobacteria bacterium]|nr:glycosyltransferase [Alphaproteobacteria bacterium]